MKVAVVNISRIVSGGLNRPFVAGDTIICEDERIKDAGTASAGASQTNEP